MRTLTYVAAAFLAMSAVSSSANAGSGYVGLGLGADSTLHGDLSDHFTTGENSHSSRIMIGQRFGAIAFEASLFGSELQGASAFTGSEEFATLSLGVDLKYHLGLFGGLEGYAKVGLDKTWLRGQEEMNARGYVGTGESFGGGLQYGFDLAMTEMNLWLDYTLQSTKLQSKSRESIEGQISMVNVGVSVGF